MNQHTNRPVFARSDVDTINEKPLRGLRTRHKAVTDCDQTKSKPVSGNQEQNGFPPYPNAISNREKHRVERIRGIHNLFWNRHSSKEFGIPVRAYCRDSVKHPDTFIMLSDVGDRGQTGSLGGSIFYTEEEEAMMAARQDMIMEMSFFESKIKDIDERLTFLHGTRT